MKHMWIIIFFLLPIIGLGYTLWHIWQVLPFSSPWRWTAIGIATLLFASMFLTFSNAIERMPLNVASIAYETGTSAIFILLYLVMTFLLLDLGRLLHIIPKDWLHSNAITSSAIALAMLSIFGYGYMHYNCKVRVASSITTDKSFSIDATTQKAAQKSSADVKIVLMSDLHLGYHNRKGELKRWIDMVNAEQPDLILIAGDIIDISTRPLIEEHMAKEFHQLSAPIYACLGNHEYYSGEPKAQQFYEEAGIHLLRDSVATIGDADSRHGVLRIIGRDDRSNQHRKPLSQIVTQAGIDRERDFTILLDHQPYHLEEAEENGIDFQFSGHTHHGQVWPVSWITDAIYEDAFGPLRKGDTQYYVSSGMGIWGGKFRIGTQSEYMVLTINQR